MYLKKLKITNGNNEIIREIDFKLGLNLIVDETPSINHKNTGNNVGKTTVLKLIDFCLGGDAKKIYVDPENKKNEYKLVKDFLINNKILVSLSLVESLNNDTSQETVIERNFLSYRNKIQKINGISKTNEEFDEALTSLLFPGHYGKKPTFRQIIAHNIRYEDQSVTNTLKNLDRYTRDDEYETLYLFLFGCNFEQGELKQNLRFQINIEEKFKNRLESDQTKSAYEVALSLLKKEIEELEIQKESLNLNPNFKTDLRKLNNVKYQINSISSEISRLELRKEIILEARDELATGISKVDVQQLKQIYQQASEYLNNIHKTFENLTDFHNKMTESKIKFITQDLPIIDKDILNKKEKLDNLLDQKSKLTSIITLSDTFDDLEYLVTELNSKHQILGEYEKVLKQLDNVDTKIKDLNKRLKKIDDELFSDEFSLKIQNQINKFNNHFSSVSQKLYEEKYALKFDPKRTKGRPIYEFKTFDLTNFSSGKKQGEISSFDIAYTLFADEENIPCMHFLLNDKKELMHGNQLLMIAQLVRDEEIQFIASILKDKLPQELNKDSYIVLKLSQNDKLFRIENNNIFKN